MYMKDINWLRIFWETVKTLAPSIVAWLLAVRTAAKRSEKDKKEAREQLRIAKDYNAEVQNKAYKLQFCITRLEKYAQVYEELISKVNVVKETVKLYVGDSQDAEELSGMQKEITIYSNEALKTLHYAQTHNGALYSTLKAADKKNKSLMKLNSVKKVEKELEEMLHCISIHGIDAMLENHTSVSYDDSVIDKSLKQITLLHKSLMELINYLFQQMEVKHVE